MTPDAGRNPWPDAFGMARSRSGLDEASLGPPPRID